MTRVDAVASTHAAACSRIKIIVSLRTMSGWRPGVLEHAAADTQAQLLEEECGGSQARRNANEWRADAFGIVPAGRSLT